MDYLQIAFDTVLIILGLYLAFGKSYFSEKGKNLATTEDIGAITKEIETVKNDIVFEIQIKSEFLKERKKIALSFNDNASFFIEYSSKVIDILTNNNNDLNVISKQMEDIRLQGAKVVSSFLNLFIYFDDDTFTNAAKEYYDSTIKIQQSAISVLFQLEQLNKEELLSKAAITPRLEVSRRSPFDNNRKIIVETYINNRKRILENEVYKSRGNYIAELSKILKIAAHNSKT